MVRLSFVLSVTAISLLRFFAEKTEGAERTGAIHQCTRARMYDASTAITWALPVKIIVKKLLSKKEQKQVSI